MTLGQVIEEYLTQNDITAVEFSKRSGLSRSYISILINGRKTHDKEPTPSVDAIFSCAKAMHTPPDVIFGKLDTDYQVVVNVPKYTRVPILKEYDYSKSLEKQSKVLDYEEFQSSKGDTPVFGLELQTDFAPFFLKGDVLILEIEKSGHQTESTYVYESDTVSIGMLISESDDQFTFMSGTTMNKVSKDDIHYMARVLELRRKY